MGLINGTSTNSKSPDRWPRGAPRRLVRGDGCKVWDDEGREWIDLASALGPVILGYRHPAVDAAIREQLERGISFSLPTPQEEELAALLCEVIPCAEAVRFAKNGADATNAAVKLARAHTGRTRIAFCGYHGHDDWYQAHRWDLGVPSSYLWGTHELYLTVEPFIYGDVGSLERLFVDEALSGGDWGKWPAAVIMEPIVAQDPVWPEPGYLQAVRDLCDKYGALLIFDEVVTGFRFPELSAQAHFGVTPDLACFSKAMANGMPISAVVGRRDVMQLLEKDVFFSTTFGGEALSIAAALATIRELRRCDVSDPLYEIGAFGMGVGRAIGESAGRGGLSVQRDLSVRGWPARWVVAWQNPEQGRIFNEAMVAQGFLWNGYINITLAHAREPGLLDRMTEAFAQAFKAVQDDRTSQAR